MIFVLLFFRVLFLWYRQLPGSGLPTYILSLMSTIVRFHNILQLDDNFNTEVNSIR